MVDGGRWHCKCIYRPQQRSCPGANLENGEAENRTNSKSFPHTRANGKKFEQLGIGAKAALCTVFHGAREREAFFMPFATAITNVSVAFGEKGAKVFATVEVVLIFQTYSAHRKLSKVSRTVVP